MSQQPPKGDVKRRRLLSAAVSGAGHLAILLALLGVRSDDPPKTVEDAPVTVAMIDLPPLPPKVTPPAAAKPTPPKPLPRHTMVRRSPARADVDSLAATDPGTELSDTQLAGAASADSGPPGGGCDMAGRVQSALRRDPLVLAAVAASSGSGKASMVWNGDWVRSGGEDGKGLAAVREAIMWEVAFAPASCRAQPMRGLVLLSLHGAAGSARLAVGAGEWRWSDLLAPRSGEAPRR
jgi:hypothetical protein